jgi:hypothetical protein
MSVRLKWTPREFKRELVAQLAANGQAVGEFVRRDARARLAGIPEPEWGAAYRRMVAGLVSYEITSSLREVVVEVGVRGGYIRWHGYYIEVGTSRQPAHPWLRPAVFNNLPAIRRLFVGG